LDHSEINDVRDKTLSALKFLDEQMKHGHQAIGELCTIDATIKVNVDRGIIPPPPKGNIISQIAWLLEYLLKAPAAKTWRLEQTGDSYGPVIQEWTGTKWIDLPGMHANADLEVRRHNNDLQYNRMPEDGITNATE